MASQPQYRYIYFTYLWYQNLFSSTNIHNVFFCVIYTTQKLIYLRNIAKYVVATVVRARHHDKCCLEHIGDSLC